MIDLAPFSSASQALRAIADASNASPAIGFQLASPVMQNSQRKSQPFSATANVGIISNSSETSTCAEKNLASAPGMT